ncbi:mRNA triphosphatase CET1 [Trematosphaeria pertusa]|uniref:mRNA-capping enzyme subunit beta n=1 Tax=Trematosphaeria pertusa TaxID=390896 RepID=A0A6A6IY89_9PLEO|nr:mRNA triphosphatase CET1 [Trematosphaeria pertusa]KAF2254997.1 mRNA triphosphatase CET1 [Trematosphaeria pertusa]
MDISALVNPVSEVPPRRSPSGSYSMPAPSPATSSAKLPTPPLSTHKPMTHKRKRHDPKPIWAIREDEMIEGLPLIPAQRQQSRPLPSTPRPQPQPPPNAMHNGPAPGPSSPHQPGTAHELIGYERPVSNDAHVYDEVSRKVCDFIFVTVVNNEPVRRAIAASPDIQVEIEARWGQIIERNTGQRLRGFHDTECVVKSALLNTSFESTMTMDQHKRMNMYLNGQVQRSKLPGAERASIDYTHTREIDVFYELDQPAFERLPPLTRELVGASKTRQRIRVTLDQKNGRVIRQLIKHRIANLEISSPQTEWDYRIGVNIEIQFPGPMDGVPLAQEPGKSLEAMKRHKDRVSYSWLDAFHLDLTQVGQDGRKNHELELELDPQVLLENGDNVNKKLPNCFESLINGMMNNLRVLSREITPAANP